MKEIAYLTMDEDGEVMRANLRRRPCWECNRPIMMAENKFGRWMPIEEYIFGKFRKHKKICRQDKVKPPYYIHL